ncbi:MAG: MATE family efflux transporter [Clostridia bacterium]
MLQTNIPAHDRLFSNRDLVRLIIPLVIEQFLAIFIGMADTVMVSTVSESAVSAISLVDSINVLLIQLFSAMATGGAVVAAQYLGRREPEHACSAAKQLLYVSLAMALVIAIPSIVFCDPILRFVFGNLSEGTMAYCRTYFYISALSYPALALYNGGAALLRAMGNSKASMYTSVMMNLVNVGGNALLIYGLHMEVAGAAIASMLSRVLAAVIMIKLLLNRSSPIHLIRPTKPEPDPRMIRRIFSQGIPNGVENSIFQVGKLLVTGIVAMFAESIIAANAVSNNIATLANLPGAAIGLAIVTVVGQCVGAGNQAQARYYSMKLLKITYACMFVTNVLLFFFARPVAGLFNLSPEGLDASTEVLQFFAVCAAFLWPASFTVPNALRAAGDAKFTMIVAVLCMWVFRIGFSYLFVYGFGMGLLGIWAGMVSDWIARAALFAWRYHSGRWLTKKVI